MLPVGLYQNQREYMKKLYARMNLPSRSEMKAVVPITLNMYYVKQLHVRQGISRAQITFYDISPQI